jgi:ESCRT-I complex subunit VPS37
MRLRHSTTAQDDASEALASSFVQQLPSNSLTSDPGAPRSMEVDEFIKEFKELRKVYHKRAMWGEKWGNGQVIWREE